MGKKIILKIKKQKTEANIYKDKDCSDLSAVFCRNI